MKKLLMALVLFTVPIVAHGDTGVTLYDSSTNYMQLKAPSALGKTYKLIVPLLPGTTGQVWSIGAISGNVIQTTFTSAGSGISAWGQITGVISSQTDLQNALNGIGSSTSTLQIQITSVGVATGTLAVSVVNLGASTGTINAIVSGHTTSIANLGASTGTIQTQVNNIAVSTGSLVTIGTAQNISGVKTFTSSITATNISVTSATVDANLVVNGNQTSTTTIYATAGNIGYAYGQGTIVSPNISWPSGTHWVNQVFFNGSDDEVDYYTPGSARSTPMMTLRSNGRAGINTTNPQFTFDINGTLNSAGALTGPTITTIATSTNTLQTNINSVGVATGTLQTQVNNIAVATGTLVTLATAQNISGTKTFTSSVSVTNSGGESVTYNINVGSMTGAGLTNCGDSSHAVSWNSTTNTFGCQSVTGTASPGGSPQQLQFNNAGALGGASNTAITGTSVTINEAVGLGGVGGAVAVASNTVLSGATFYFGVSVPVINAPGSNTNLVFNNGGIYSAGSSMAWNGTNLGIGGGGNFSGQMTILGSGTVNNVLSVSSFVVTGATMTIGGPQYIFPSSVTLGGFLEPGGGNVLQWSTNGSNLSNLKGANIASGIPSTILPSTVAYNSIDNTFSATETFGSSVTVNNVASVSSMVVTGGTVTLNSVQYLFPSSGTVGNFAQYGSGGKVYWAPASGGATSPGGSASQVQYNSGGSFAGSGNLLISASSVTAAGSGGLAVTYNVTAASYTNAVNNPSGNSNNAGKVWHIDGVNFSSICALMGTLPNNTVGTIYDDVSDTWNCDPFNFDASHKFYGEIILGESTPNTSPSVTLQVPVHISTKSRITGKGRASTGFPGGSLIIVDTNTFTTNSAFVNDPVVGATVTTTTSGCGTFLPARTYYVTFTYSNPAGETKGSPETLIATSGSNCLSVTDPGASGGSTSYNAYVSTFSGAEEWQANKAHGSNLTIGGADINMATGATPFVNATAALFSFGFMQNNSYASITARDGIQMSGMAIDCNGLSADPGSPGAIAIFNTKSQENTLIHDIIFRNCDGIANIVQSGYRNGFAGGTSTEISKLHFLDTTLFPGTGLCHNTDCDPTYGVLDYWSPSLREISDVSSFISGVTTAAVEAILPKVTDPISDGSLLISKIHCGANPTKACVEVSGNGSIIDWVNGSGAQTTVYLSSLTFNTSVRNINAAPTKSAIIDIVNNYRSPTGTAVGFYQTGASTGAYLTTMDDRFMISGGSVSARNGIFQATSDSTPFRVQGFTGGVSDIVQISSGDGTKIWWIDGAGNVNRIGNNQTLGTAGQTTQSFLKMVGSQSPNASAYLQFFSQDGSTQAFISQSFSSPNGICISSYNVAGDCGANSAIITPSSITIGAIQTNGSGGGSWDATEGTCIAGASGHDIMCADSSSHAMSVINNNGTKGTIMLVNSTDTVTAPKTWTAPNTFISSITVGTIAWANGTVQVSSPSDARAIAVGVDTGTLRTQLNTAGVSTGTLQTQANNIAVATGTIQTQVNNIAVATGTIQTQVNNVAVATGTLQTQVNNIAVATGTLQTQVNNIAVATGTLVTLSTNQLISATKTFSSSVTINSSLVASTAVFTGGIYITSSTNFGASGIVTSNYTTSPTDSIIYASAPAAGLVITVNYASMSVVQGSNQHLEIVKVSGSTYPVTVLASGSDLFGGTTGLLTLDAIGQADEMVSGPQGWMPRGLGFEITPPYVTPTVDNAASAATVVATSSNVYYGAIYVPVSVVGLGCAFAQTAQGGVSTAKEDCGVYDNAGKLLASAGATIPFGVGASTVAFTAPVNLGPGKYILGITINNVTTSIAGIAASNIPGWALNTQTGQSTVPATLTLPGTTSTKVFGVQLIVAGGSKF